MNEYDDAPNVAGWEPTIAPPPPEPTVEMPDVAPNVSPWTPQSPPSWMSVAQGLSDPYSRESLSQPYQPPAQSYYGASAGLGETFGNIAGGLFDVLEAPSGAVGGFLSGATPRESLRGAVSGFQNPDFSQFRDIGFVRNLPDEDVLPFNLSARDVAGGIAGAVLDPLNVVGIGKADEAARLAGRGIAAGREAIGDLAPDVARGARRLATEEAGGIRLPFGRGDQPPKMDITDVTKALDQPMDAVSTLLGRIKDAKPLEEMNAELLGKFREQQAARFRTNIRPGGGIEGFKQAMSSMSGKAERMTFTPMRELMDEASANRLMDTITSSNRLKDFEQVNAGQAFLDILDGVVPTPYEMEQLEKVFPGLIQSMQEAKILGKTPFMERALDAANAFRALQSTADMSASLRQAVFLAPRHRTEWKNAMGAQLRSLTSEDAAKAIQFEIENNPLVKYRKNTSLFQADWQGTDLQRREEQFMSSMAENLPIVKQTSRAYAIMLNKYRADVFDGIVSKWADADRTPERLETLAKYINAASGRGSLPRWMQQFAPAMNALFFSPRFLVSIPQRHAFAFTRDPLIRNEAIKDLLAFYGTGATILGSLAVANEAGLLPKDTQINLTNYEDPDWGKIKIGPTRIDIWGGHQQFARMVLRAGTRGPTWMSGRAKAGDNPVNVIGQYLRYKFSPVANLADQLRTGKNVVGEKQSPAEVAIRMVTPIFWQELVEAYQTGGTRAALLTTPGFFGVGVQNYNPRRRAGSGGPPKPPSPPKPAVPKVPKMAEGGIVEDGEKVVITPEQWKTVLEVIKDVVRDESGKMVEVKERHAVPDRPEPKKRVVKETHRSDDGKIARVVERHQEMAG